MTAARNASKMTCALAVLAVLLRVLLPALHTHHAHAPAGAASHGGSATVAACSCGVVHESRVGGTGGAVTPSTPHIDDGGNGAIGHTCLACELEDGTPCAGPAPALHSVPAAGASARPPSQYLSSLACSQLQLPRSRAPPTQQA